MPALSRKLTMVEMMISSTIRNRRCACRNVGDIDRSLPRGWLDGAHQRYNQRMRPAGVPWLIGVALAAVACSSSATPPSDLAPDASDLGPGTADLAPSGWTPTGAQAAFPAALAVDKATALTIGAEHIYWITTDGFLYRAPRSPGAVDRVALPAPATHVWVHNDL